MVKLARLDLTLCHKRLEIAYFLRLGNSFIVFIQVWQTQQPLLSQVCGLFQG
jgi:hypothetical protein